MMNSYSENNRIVVSWDGYCKKSNKIILNIYENELLFEEVTIKKATDSYIFMNGKHGALYRFELVITDTKKSIEEKFSTQSLFVDYSQLPDLPFLNIVTDSGNDPSMEISKPPEGCWGMSISNNEYVEGYMTYISKNKSYSTSLELEIKIRGNTSALGEKKSYKLKLDDRVDLLERQDDAYKSKEWILLNSGSNLNTCIGNIISQECRKDWQPCFEYVNLMVNGDWKGCFILIECVEKGEKRCDITSDGFIIENNPYWWNGEVNYFKSKYQWNPLAYTLTYPNSKMVDIEKVNDIEKYIDNIESMLYNNDIEFMEYMDTSSFARWVLSHDILGSYDYAGSNMYMYNYNYLSDQKDINQLKMGPTWDFDAIMGGEEQWATIHESNAFYYQKLFTYPEFIEKYKEAWVQVKDEGMNAAIKKFDEYVEKNGVALQESWELEASRYSVEIVSVLEQQSNIKKWLYDRTEWIQQNI